MTVVFGVETRRVSGVAVASLKDVVGIVTGHDKVAAHNVELVLALESGGGLIGAGNTDTEADLVVRNVVHPLLVENILAGNVRGDVTTDRVAHVGGAVWVQFATEVTRGKTDLGKVADSHELNVERGLDKVSTRDGSIGLKRDEKEANVIATVITVSQTVQSSRQCDVACQGERSLENYLR